MASRIFDGRNIQPGSIDWTAIEKTSRNLKKEKARFCFYFRKGTAKEETSGCFDSRRGQSAVTETIGFTPKNSETAETGLFLF
jgi:hypothetical protein